ncbi:hypothetical protein ACFQDN_22215 [Pseudomonas asuensis]|uniref:Uncharacterized protein n=1 Tax=Pseudomonas asuensis TaxID=1825787 RepID=A0ABQ2H2K1_9PSED|nr:hypothetical protein [Pseudomonas asuensis]GGM25937.1 hypothetical protein GCM10009425_40840 [Pseudomonas asuensis]
MNSTLIAVSAMICNHLTSQAQESIIDGEFLYKTENGLADPVGALLDNAAYSSDIEGHPVEHLDINLIVESLQRAGVVVADDSRKDLLHMLIVWQEYHENYIDLGDVELAYSEWVDGKVAHSPQKLHAAIISGALDGYYEV